MAQDTRLSRGQQGFESPTGRQFKPSHWFYRSPLRDNGFLTRLLQDFTVSSEVAFDRIATPETSPSHSDERAPTLHSAENASIPVERYIETTAREREWPTKTEIRERAELREFIEVRGDQPINAYRQEGGVKRRLASHP